MARPSKTSGETPAKKAGYTPQKKDAGAVHARIQKPPLFDINTGEPTGTDFVQMFEPRVEWPEFVRRSQGWIIKEVLFIPDGFKDVDTILKEEAEKQLKRFGK